MRITKITKVKSHIIRTDEGYWSTYRRNGPEDWEQLMGESWEGINSCEKLEELFQEAKNWEYSQQTT